MADTKLAKIVKILTKLIGHLLKLRRVVFIFSIKDKLWKSKI